MSLQIDRREFLKSLLAIGATVALPVAIADATPAQIDTAWATLTKKPWTLKVNQSDTIIAPGARGKARALSFFVHEYELCNALGIEIVEGEHPGSTYYAAELHKPIAFTNSEAERMGLPFRFRRVSK